MGNKIKYMKLKDLKKIVNKLTKEQLEQELLYNSKTHSISGVVEKVVKQKQNLYYDGSDDPATLYTLKELKENYDKDEVEEFTVEIQKGAIVIQF